MVINIFKKKNKDVKSEKKLVLICALFVHAAKMDENYTDKEKLIILKALLEMLIARPLVKNGLATETPST